MLVGFSVFGVATIVGGRIAPRLRERLKNNFLLFAGLLGSVSLVIISFSPSPVLIGIALFRFGLAFVSLQATLVSTAQETMPKLRGTAMSLASFNMFVGGAIGTSVNGRIINVSSIGTIFLTAAGVMLLVAFLASTIVRKINTQANKAVGI